MGFGDPDSDGCGGNGGANPGSSSQLADKVDFLSRSTLPIISNSSRTHDP